MMLKRVLTLLLFCALSTGVALADAPSGNGGSGVSGQGNANGSNFQQAWPVLFAPGGVPYQASWIPNVTSDAACHIISSTALNWGFAVINQFGSTQTNTLTIYSGTTCSGAASVQYPVPLGAAGYVEPPFPIIAWASGASYKSSGALSGSVSVVYY